MLFQLFSPILFNLWIYTFIKIVKLEGNEPTRIQTPLGLCRHDPTELDPKALSTEEKLCSQTSGHHLEEWEKPAAQAAHGERKDVNGALVLAVVSLHEALSP